MDVHGVTESDMTEQLSLHFSSLSTQSLKEFLVELVIIIFFFLFWLRHVVS